MKCCQFFIFVCWVTKERCINFLIDPSKFQKDIFIILLLFFLVSKQNRNYVLRFVPANIHADKRQYEQTDKTQNSSRVSNVLSIHRHSHDTIALVLANNSKPHLNWIGLATWLSNTIFRDRSVIPISKFLFAICVSSKQKMIYSLAPVEKVFKMLIALTPVLHCN